MKKKKIHERLKCKLSYFFWCNMLGMTTMSKKCIIFDTKRIPSEFLNDGIYANLRGL